MKGRLKEKIGKANAFETLQQEVFLTLLHAADALIRPFDELFRDHALSPTQYNVLRILRAGPEGLACREIGQRMITRDPDMTRLLDRLEAHDMIARRRQSDDRRVVRARIMPAGLSILARLDEPVRRLHIRQFAHINRRRLQQLLTLLNEVQT